jgi:hypothetical protein
MVSLIGCSKSAKPFATGQVDLLAGLARLEFLCFVGLSPVGLSLHVCAGEHVRVWANRGRGLVG